MSHQSFTTATRGREPSRAADRIDAKVHILRSLATGALIALAALATAQAVVTIIELVR